MKNLTDITIILDRSGSMHSIKSDMEGGLASFMADQAKLPDPANVSLYLFDDKYEVAFENTPIQNAPAITLTPRGTTALLDAVGKTITSRGEYYASLPEEERPDKVVVIIVTDGRENASSEYTLESIKEMVTLQQDTYKWTFVFLGANFDAVSVGADLGFKGCTSMSYRPTTKGVSKTYRSLSNAVTMLREGGQSVQFSDEDRDGAMQ